MAVNTDLHAADRGMDRDFCCHSNNKSSYDFNVWTCSKCGYSNHKSFFSFGPTTAFTDAEKEAIKAQWVTVFLETLGVNLIQYAAPISQEDIPSFLKYQMMLSILPKLNLPWKVKADFYLNYAWIERLRFCASISSPTLSTTISSINESLKDYEKGKNLDHLVSNPKDLLVFLETLDVKSRSDLGYKFLLKLYQAAQMDRLGFNGRANEIVKEAKETTDLRV